MQIKTTMRYYLTPVRILLSKSLQTINAGEGVKKRECCYTVGSANLQPPWRTVKIERPLKTENRTAI